MGRLFGIMVEKGSELKSFLADGVTRNPLKKYKYRVVFQGNRVINQDWQAAQFQNQGSTPATMEAGKVADWYACQKGHIGTQADAIQAYVQADLQGKTTWVNLPDVAWPAEWKAEHR